MSNVLDEIVSILTDVVGEDFLLDTEITPDTRFSDDLGLESIEFVALAEKLREHYGDQVNLIAFIGNMDINEVMGLTVGSVAGYVESVSALPADAH